MRISRLYEIQSILAESGHMDAVKDIEEVILMQRKLALVHEILMEKQSASNVMVSKIKIVVDGDDDELSGLLG